MHSKSYIIVANTAAAAESALVHEILVITHGGLINSFKCNKQLSLCY